MKLRLHWGEKYHMVREYPTFELDSETFPQLEAEMLQVYNAGSFDAQQQALGQLEYKMQTTKDPRGETIFSMVGPFNKSDQSIVYPVTEEQGFLNLTGEAQ